MKRTLYKRNANNEPIYWSINAIGNTITITHGKVGSGTEITDVICCTMVSGVEKEVASRINAKRKEGYVEMTEVYDNTPENKIIDVAAYLRAYLPKYNASNGEFILPMLAKTLEDNRPFDKLGTLRGQWKINGLRCEVGLKADTNSLFDDKQLIFQSREGAIWSFPVLEAKLLETLPKQMFELMQECNAYIDGEIYYPGMTVNEINHLVKNTTDPRRDNLQFWIYDIAMDNTIYDTRRLFIISYLKDFIKHFNDKNQHLENKDTIVVLPEVDIINYEDAVEERDKYINLGFEGLILRNPNAEYGFGKRSVELMYKFKKIEDGKFLIVGVIPEGKKRQDLCKLLLKNDINDSLFECTVNATHQVQRDILENKHIYLDEPHYAKVEYRERSGINQVPFHAKAVQLL